MCILHMHTYCILICKTVRSPGFGLPDDVVIEKSGRGDMFVQCSADMIAMSNIKFVQHDTVEGILGKFPF